MFFKIGVLKNSTDFTVKHLCYTLFLIKLEAFSPATLYKTTPAQVCSCEICKNCKSTFSYRTPPVAASVNRKMKMTAVLASIATFNNLN